MIPDGQQAATHQQEAPLFVCDECGEPVIVFKGKQFKTCEHADAAVNVTPLGIKAISGL